MTEKTFRCGWRVDHPAGIDAWLEWRSFGFPQVVIRRGAWRGTMYPELYDAMSDEQFADYMGRMYRESAFDQLQQDLDTLARRVADFEAGFGTVPASVPATVPYSDVKSALWRWQQVQRDTEPGYEDFLRRARSLGLSLHQAQTVFRSGNLLAGYSTASPEARLEHFAKHGYLTVLLSEVLTLEELKKLSFSYGAVLNGRMDSRYGKHFAALDRDRQRALVESAIEVTAQLGGTEEGWPLERAMAVVMPDLGEV